MYGMKNAPEKYKKNHENLEGLCELKEAQLQRC